MAANGITKMMRPMVKITKSGIRFIGKNSNMILTIVGATGVLATVVCAVKGTIKAVKLCEEKQVTDGKEVLQTVWKCYIPTIGFLILTTTAIICNGKINAKKIAVLTSAYSGSVEALKKVEEKMSEEIGPKKTDKILGEADKAVAQEHMPKRKEDIYRTGKGDQLFYFRSTGQWIYSSRAAMEAGEVKCQKDIMEIQNKMVLASEYYMAEDALRNIGFEEPTEFGEYMGWDVDDYRDGREWRLIISSEWMDLPWGKEIVGIVRFADWPVNI